MISTIQQQLDNEVYQHFKDSIVSELTSNLKPVISSLTMLADDYRINSRDVVRAVEEYIDQVCGTKSSLDDSSPTHQLWTNTKKSLFLIII